MSTDLYSIEHQRGLHEVYSPPGCTLCPAQPRRIATTPPPAAQPTAVEATPHTKNNTAAGNLGPALERVIKRMVVDEPDEPDLGPQAPDGHPWCTTCSGVRTVAVRQSRQPTTYIRCPDCATAPWRIQHQIDRLFGALPPKFQPWRLTTFPDHVSTQHEVLERAIDWLDHPGTPSLYLWGPSGRGKTGLAVSLLYELALRGCSTAFKVAPDLMTHLKASFDGEDTETSILEVCASADVFCLDDLGTEHHRNGGQDWATEKLFQVINARHANLKRTIITSNYSLTELKEKLGHPRIPRRIHEMTDGNHWIIDFRGLPYVSEATHE